MNEINNLTYTLEIKYTSKSGLKILIFIKLHDDGLETKSIKVGNTCITEETLNGRILSGRLDNDNGYCGYRYDYQNGENLMNINPNISLDSAISLINKTKMDEAFLSAKLVLSSISRNDYRVVILNNGVLNVTRTVSIENEKCKKCSLQECIDLLKFDKGECFVEQQKKRVYKIDDKCILEENQNMIDSDIKLQLNVLSHILSKAPQNYKELIELKSRFQLQGLTI